MIVNAPGILALLFAAIEFTAACILLGVAGRALLRRSANWEPLRHLVLLLVLLLATLSAVSLFVWMLLLQSYVPQWADVLCVVGVLRIGTDSEGATGWLPALAAATSWLRGSLLFAAGVGVVLHLVGRTRPEGRLPRTHLLTLCAISLLAVAGATTEIAYIVIPKTQRLKPMGCCGAPAASAARPVAAPISSRHAGRDALVYGLSAGAAVAVLVTVPTRFGRRPWIVNAALLCSATVVLVAGLHFATEVVAPLRMGLPLHRCLYCLVAEAPETFVGVSLLVMPPTLAGWRASARWLGGGGDLGKIESGLDRATLFCVAAGALFFAEQWVVS